MYFYTIDLYDLVDYARIHIFHKQDYNIVRVYEKKTMEIELKALKGTGR